MFVPGKPFRPRVMKHSRSFGPFVSYGEIKVLLMWSHIHNTSFTLKLTNEPNKLECFMTRGRNGLPVTNTTAYWAHSKLMNEIECCEYRPVANVI
jgi:hypothetical protein